MNNSGQNEAAVILVAAEGDGLRRAISATLEKHGQGAWRVKETASRREALDRLRREGACALLVADHALADGSGLELCREALTRNLAGGALLLATAEGLREAEMSPGPEPVIRLYKDPEGLYQSLLPLVASKALGEPGPSPEDQKLSAAKATAGAACHALAQPLQAAILRLEALTWFPRPQADTGRELAALRNDLDRMSLVLHDMRRLEGFVTQSYAGRDEILDLSRSIEAHTPRKSEPL